MKKIIVLSIILLLTISTMINVYAASSFKMSLKSSKNEVNKNEEFVVDVNMSDIQIDKGIIALGGTLEYDKDSLEIVKMEGENTWATPSYNDANGKFATDRGDYGASDETVFKITFKVKEESKQNLTITLVEASASNGKDEVKLKDIKTNITVKNGTTNPDNPNPNTNTSNNNTSDNNNTTNTNSNNNNNNNNNDNNKNNTSNNTNSNRNNTANQNKSNNTNISNDIKSGILPKAGANAILFGSIGMLIIIAGIFYARIRIIENKTKK